MVVTIFECIPIEVSLPIFASILIFVAGVCVNYISTRWKIYRQRKNLRKNVVVFLSGLIGMLNKYVENLRELSLNIQKSDIMNPESFEFVNVSVSYMDRFDINQVSDALLHGIKEYDKQKETIRDNFYLYHVQLEYIKVAKQHIEQTYDEYRANIHRMTAKWSNLWVDLCSELDKYTSMDDLPDEDKNKYQEINALTMALTAEFIGKDIPLLKMEVYVKGVISIIGLSHSRNFDHMMEIVSMMLRFIYERKSANGYAQKFDQYATSFAQVTAKLEEILKFYQGCETRW